MGDGTEKRGEKSSVKGVVIKAFPADMESECRKLFELVSDGAREVVEELGCDADAMQDVSYRKRFFSSANKGFYEAQEKVLKAFLEEDVSFERELLLRGIMDVAVWQIFSYQLYIARRLYKEQRQPSLKHSSVESMKAAVDSLTSEDFYSIALLSDLTSFVQVGDVVAFDPDRGYTIVEVKEGEVNKRILDFSSFYEKTRCAKALSFFKEREGKKVYKQFERVMRQKGRMKHFQEIMESGDSYDPDSKYQVRISESDAEMDSWDEKLDDIIERSKERGWALDVIESCLFVAAYRNNFRFASDVIFNYWFEECAGNADFPKVNFIDCMGIPLALPVLSRHIDKEAKFDVLFGRVVVRFGLDLDAFIELCNSMGLKARWSTRKEAEKIKKETGGCMSFTINKKMVFIEGEEGGVGPLSDGILARIFYHGLSPVSAVKMLKHLFSVDSW
ncbi:hypothetical protein [Halomonas smyrnensis]|uniref:hypothetical protein n=1 Tax=Halomonas smyrnensis TaxID=720605 RepID=UPI0012EAED50|nr:hypothetical protein [Halomonas smyrnensis]